MSFLLDHVADHSVVIKILRVSDFLGLSKFHELYINQVILNSLNHDNCIVLLEETQKKLKNLENGAQCWFSLLNATIHFVATNLFEIFKKEPNKLRRMNEKILNEVLDRAIKLEKKSGYEGRHMLFKVIMDSKGMDSATSLCKHQRNLILQKKINRNFGFI